MPFYVGIVSDQPCNTNGPSALVRNELVPQLRLGKMEELRQAVVFVLCETLMYVIMKII